MHAKEMIQLRHRLCVETHELINAHDPNEPPTLQEIDALQILAQARTALDAALQETGIWN